MARAEIRRWVRSADSTARDGVPAQAFSADTVQPGRLPQRDFDLGRNIGLLPGDGAPAAATAVLITAGDGPADWLRAGQAMHRILLRAATAWVFGRSAHTQPLEVRRSGADQDPAGAAGEPETAAVQLGLAHTTQATARLRPDELLIKPRRRTRRGTSAREPASRLPPEPAVLTCEPGDQGPGDPGRTARDRRAPARDPGLRVGTGRWSPCRT